MTNLFFTILVLSICFIGTIIIGAKGICKKLFISTLKLLAIAILILGLIAANISLDYYQIKNNIQDRIKRR